MHEFKDGKNRAWKLEINVSSLKRVKSLLAINLLDVINGDSRGGLLQDIAGNPELLCDIIYTLIKPQADAAAVTDEQFGEAMAGDAIGAATDALLEELCDFFPQPRRGLMQNALKKIKQLEALGVERGNQILTSDQLETKLMESIATASAGGSPASLESTPAR
jgi:hypothetical protein